MASSTNLTSIQILRGFAAFLIVIRHSDLALELFRADYWRDVRPSARALLYPFWANHLNIGVDIFFCISGFIMAMLANKAGKSEAWPFLRARLARIVPPYWFFTLCLLALYNISSGFHTWRLTGFLVHDVPATVLSFLLLPQRNGPILAIGWTLLHEFLFYYFVTALIWLGRGKSLLFYLGGAAIIGVALRLLGGELFYGYLFSDYYVEFFMGALAFACHQRVARFFPSLQLLAALALYLATSYLMDVFLAPIPNSLINVTGSGLIGFLLINGLIGLDAKHDLKAWALGRLGAKIGGASYSLYLSHWFSLSLIGKLAAPFANAATPVIIVWHVGAILATVAIAVLFASKVELPLHRKLVHWLAHDRQPQQNPPVSRP